jgi:hypothetical protein
MLHFVTHQVQYFATLQTGIGHRKIAFHGVEFSDGTRKLHSNKKPESNLQFFPLIDKWEVLSALMEVHTVIAGKYIRSLLGSKYGHCCVVLTTDTC